MSNGIGHVWAVNAEGGDEGRPNGVGPVWIENADQLGSKLPEPEAGDAGKVLGVLNADGDIGWVPDQEGMAQVQADWDQTDSSQVSYIANKPSLATVATTGAYSDLSGKPTIPTATSDLQNDSGFITLSDVPAQEQADWNETNTSDPSYIQNKPTIPSVDQNYNAASTNAQSGTAVAQAIAAIPSASYTAGNGIAISNQNAISVNHDSTLSSSHTTTGNLGTYDRVSFYTIAYTLTAEEQAMLNGTSETPISSISISIASEIFTMDGYLSANEKLYLQISTDSSLSSANTARYYGSYVNHSSGDEETYNSAGTVTINMPVGNSTGWTSQSLTFGNKLYLSMCVASTSDTTSVVTDTSELLSPYVDAEYYRPAPTITYTSVSSKLSIVNPLPASAVGDANKVLTVNNSGVPVWANQGTSGSVNEFFDWSTVTASDIATCLANGHNPIIRYEFTENQTIYAYLEAVEPMASGTAYTFFTPVKGTASNDLKTTTRLYIPDWTTKSATRALHVSPPACSSTDAGKVLTVNLNGYAVWDNVPTELPTVTSSDDGKVLKAAYSGGTGSYAWESEPTVLGLTAGSNVTITEANNAVTIAATDTTYTAGNMIAIDANNSNAIGVSTTAGITDIQLVNALPASPVATVLYIVPET